MYIQYGVYIWWYFTVLVPSVSIYTVENNKNTEKLHNEKVKVFPDFWLVLYLGWHVRLILKQTSIQSLLLVASKVWIQLIKIKVYIFLPYFTHKIKTLFWTPSKMGVLKYLTFVSQINVMWQKIKHKNCTKMIKFILKILAITWCKEHIILLFYVTDHKPN